MEKQSKFKFSIVLVSFPFEDFKTQKVRPALCLTEPIGNHEHVVLAFISSRIPESLDESDLLIETKADSGKTRVAKGWNTGMQEIEPLRFF